MPTLGWMVLSSLTLGEDPLKDMGTSSMWFALEGSDLQLEKKMEEQDHKMKVFCQ
jgi:hypothetical protein